MNKRQLKKQVRGLSAGLACDIAIASEYITDMNPDKIVEMIRNTARAQQKAIKCASAVFDKTPRDFESRAAYNKARRAYFHKLFDKLSAELNAHADAVVDELNSFLTPEDRETNKAKA